MNKQMAFFLMSIFLMGCATPSPVFFATPVDSTPKWSNGINYIQKEAHGIVYSVGYAEHDGDQIRFSVDIDNNSGDTVEINPALFECQGYQTQIPDSALKLQPIYRCSALDPETLLTNINIDREQAITAQKNAPYQRIVTNTIGALFSEIFSVLLNTAPKTESEKAQQDAQQAENNRLQAEQEDRQFEGHMNELDRMQDFFEYEALRRTTLYPKNYMSGKIVFPMVKRALLILVRYPTIGSSIQMWFDHKPATQSQRN
jgi:hypothetical protein